MGIPTKLTRLDLTIALVSNFRVFRRALFMAKCLIYGRSETTTKRFTGTLEKPS